MLVCEWVCYLTNNMRCVNLFVRTHISPSRQLKSIKRIYPSINYHKFLFKSDYLIRSHAISFKHNRVGSGWRAKHWLFMCGVRIHLKLKSHKTPFIHDWIACFCVMPTWVIKGNGRCGLYKGFVINVLTEISEISIGFRAWINNYIYINNGV